MDARKKRDGRHKTGTRNECTPGACSGNPDTHIVNKRPAGRRASSNRQDIATLRLDDGTQESPSSEPWRPASDNPTDKGTLAIDVATDRQKRIPYDTHSPFHMSSTHAASALPTPPNVLSCQKPTRYVSPALVPRGVKCTSVPGKSSTPVALPRRPTVTPVRA